MGGTKVRRFKRPLLPAREMVLLLLSVNWGSKQGGLTALERFFNGLMDRGASCFISFITFFFREENLHFFTEPKFTDGATEESRACLFLEELEDE